jgi:hypothetical protein
MKRTKRPLWKCPRCGAKLVTRNLWHACGRFSLKALFARSEPHVWRVYQEYVKAVRAIGPITVIPQKSRFVFMTRIRFAGGIPRKSYLDAHFLYPGPLRSPRITSSMKFSPHQYAHRVPLRTPRDLDTEFRGWLRTAYRVGMQERE